MMSVKQAAHLNYCVHVLYPIKYSLYRDLDDLVHRFCLAARCRGKLHHERVHVNNHQSRVRYTDSKEVCMVSAKL